MKQFYHRHEEWIWFTLAVLSGLLAGLYVSTRHFCKLEGFCRHNDLITLDEIIAGITLFAWVYLFHFSCIGVRYIIKRLKH